MNFCDILFYFIFNNFIVLLPWKSKFSLQMKSGYTTKNIYLVLAWRILLAMLLFSLCRIGFYLFNHKMFPDISPSQMLSILRGGLVFDISAIVYFNSLVIFNFRYDELYQKIVKYIYFVTNGIALAMNGMDFVYYRFVDKRATADVFGTFKNESNLFRLFFRFLGDYWPATIFTIILWILMGYLYNLVKPVKPAKNTLARISFEILMIPMVLALVIGAARGGYRHSTRPITISNATKYVSNPRDAAIVLNTPFSILRTFDKKPLVKYNFFDDNKLESIYNTKYLPDTSAPFDNENVVIIILESFAREYIGAFNKDLEGGKYKGYTPFIDSLINESLTFDISLANGKKSIDAMPSILASIPSLETPFIISHYANNHINSLPSLLKKKGYYSAFFHGAPNGSMGFDSFAKQAGFDNYFGLNEYPVKSDFDGIWGVWDEPFFSFFADKLSTFHKPFIASIFSVSSHHPFKVPEKYTGRFPAGPAPILEVVGYTDYSLREFFHKISGTGWFRNTLFVITADHTNESVHKEYQNNLGVYSIPIIFYKPGSDLRGTSHRIAQQVDIMPTILSYLHYDSGYIAFGSNLLDNSQESFAFNTSGSTYHLYMKDHLLEMVDNKPVGLFNYREDRLLEKNLLGTEPNQQSQMVEKLKAIIQTYNERLVDNNMVVK